MSKDNQAQHDAENTYPKISGNMMVKSRCPEHGYNLRCACQTEFQYIPGGAGSVTVNGSVRAMCPTCNTLWSEALIFRQRPPQVFLGFYLTTEKVKDKLVTLGFGFDKISIVSKFFVDIESYELEFSAVRIQILTREEFETARKELNAEADCDARDIASNLFDNLFKGW